MASGSEWVLGSVIFSASNQLHGLEKRGCRSGDLSRLLNWKTAATPAAVAP